MTKTTYQPANKEGLRTSTDVLPERGDAATRAKVLAMLAVPRAWLSAAQRLNMDYQKVEPQQKDDYDAANL